MSPVFYVYAQLPSAVPTSEIEFYIVHSTPATDFEVGDTVTVDVYVVLPPPITTFLLAEVSLVLSKYKTLDHVLIL